MDLIPVLDLMGGQVVRAVRGQRSAYLPMQSMLCEGSDPLAMARALRRHTSSGVLYVADLDALQGGAVQHAVLRELLAGLPGLRIWLDAGFADRAAASAVLDQLDPAEAAAIDPVFASESLRDAQALAACFAPEVVTRDAIGARAILSLDRRDGQRLDAAGCWERPDAWPQRVIVMTLERVGAQAGPDLDTLAALRLRSPHTQFIGAGGVRDAADLRHAAAAGAQAWLVASALHDGRLAASDASASRERGAAG
ncbi:histidine biosynthesis protein [Leptothrix cholodnii SP-6]|uniref:Histidine biosynthesis protein n=1 Tax=Leptothrix cholodnii (strain ATCC 51168 / LMG 8142 / SP-6) TaxID=395495 RepID=B1Y0Y0_LEPCP|nr:HisA/HisF-related TIM barrel protein [Leptothrix cholodnii]ACB35397.1 histidine biosynthesis protein [Leptothrix cholodnii SP-6]